MKTPGHIFPYCRSLMGEVLWNELTAGYNDLSSNIEEFIRDLAGVTASRGFPPYLPELARLEYVQLSSASDTTPIVPPREKAVLNPTLRMLELSWRHLTVLFHDRDAFSPKRGTEIILIWKDPSSDEVQVEPASRDDLLVLKIVAENLDRAALAASVNLPADAIDELVERAAEKRLVLLPRSADNG